MLGLIWPSSSREARNGTVRRTGCVAQDHVGLVVEAGGKVVWEGTAISEPPSLTQALFKWRKKIKLIGIEACPLSEWLYGALIESGFTTVCIETRHTQRFLSSRPNKTDRSDARGIAEMMRLGHFKPVHVKSRQSQLVRTTLMRARNSSTTCCRSNSPSEVCSRCMD